MDKQLFINPPSEYREVPLWLWNDDLDPEELRRQIVHMDEGGWGGFLMHTRVGLRMQYLGKLWFDDVRVCVEKARKRGMTICHGDYRTELESAPSDIGSPQGEIKTLFRPT